MRKSFSSDPGNPAPSKREPGAGSRAMPDTRYPRLRSSRTAHAPLNPVCPVTSTCTRAAYAERMPPAARYPITQARGGLLAAAVCAMTIAAVSILTAVPIWTALVLAIFVVWQSVAGAVVWSWLRPQAPTMEWAGAALAVGTMVAALAGVVSATIGLGPWGWFVPSAIATGVVLIRARNSRNRSLYGDAEPSGYRSLPSVIGLLAAVLPGSAIVLYALQSYPLTWSGTLTSYHPDMPFFEAISIHLARYGAFETPFVTEGSIRYHWLSYAWAGQLTVAADAAPFITITRVLPVVALLGSAAMVASWTYQLSRQSWTPALAGLLLSVGGFTGAVFGGVFSMDSPSQSMSVLWLIAFSIAVLGAVRSPIPLLPTAVLVFVLAFALMGGKVSAAAPAVAGVLTLTAVELLRREGSAARSIGLLVATIGGSVAGFGFFLAGSLGGGGLTLGSLVDKASSQQGLNPMDTRHAVVFGTALMALAVLPRWAGLLWLLAKRDWRWRPEVTYSIGLAGSSLLALLLFNSFNEVWFSSTVSGPLAAITAVGVGAAVRSIVGRYPNRTTPVLLTGALIAAATFGLVWQLWATGASGGNVWVPTWRWLGPVAVWAIAIAGGVLLAWIGSRHARISPIAAGIVIILVLTSVPGRFLGFGTGLVGIQENGLRGEWFSIGEQKYARGRDFFPLEQWTDSRMQSALWLRDNANITDLLGTNLTIGPFVPGVTHLPTYVSAIGYQSPYGPAWMSPILLQHEAQVWDFLEEPSATNAAPLCDANVTWLWIDLKRAPLRNWEPYYTIRLATQDTVIAELNPSAC